MFNPSDAERFAKQRGISFHRKGDELIFKKCPYCGKSTIGNKDDEKFSINLKTGQFHCFRASCGADGNMITLAKDFDFELSKDFEAYYRPKKQYREFKTPEEPIIPKEPALAYLESRGIHKSVAEIYGITVRNDLPNILVFPFFDENGKLQFIKYRKTDFDKEKDKNKEWAEPNGKPILFGMKQCNPANKTLIVAEGQIDSLSIAEAGYENAVSVPTGARGFTWVPHCWDWLQNFDTIIVFGDHERGEITLLDEFSRRFGKRIKHVRPEDYLDCKDANDILRKYGVDQIHKCIDNSVPIPVKQVVDLSTVENIDVFKIEKLKTGIYEVDRLLYGGLPFGGVHLLTGKAGQGKSTLGSQILIRAKKQGYKCFAYSGELPNYLFKSWMDLQVAGRKCTIEFQDSDLKFAGYTISKTNRDLISEWYKGSIFLYDNSVIETDEMQGLLKITEEVIQQYGVRVILLDNLMTAMLLDSAKGSDQYERQTDFVNKLRVLALRYNVLIILIAHMRKNNFSNGDGNDEVAGSSNITNIAMITMAYERGKDQKDEERLIKIFKNRLFGKINTDGIQVDFDERSRRIFGRGDDPDYDYGFDPNSDGFLPLPEDIAF